MLENETIETRLSFNRAYLYSIGNSAAALDCRTDRCECGAKSACNAALSGTRRAHSSCVMEKGHRYILRFVIHSLGVIVAISTHFHPSFRHIQNDNGK